MLYLNFANVVKCSWNKKKIIAFFSTINQNGTKVKKAKKKSVKKQSTKQKKDYICK